MVEKDNRQYQLINLLMNSKSYMTSETLAETLNISKKTIYRMIKSINDETGSDLIQSDKGKGYRLDYSLYRQWEKSNQTNQDISPKMRRFQIMKDLLLVSPEEIAVYDILDKYFIGESVLVKDEVFIGRMLEPFHLTLRRKNRFLSIQGVEENVRQAMLSLLQQYSIVDIEDLTSNLDMDFNPNDVSFVLEQLENMEDNLSSPISYPYNINIFLHLYILIQRYKLGRCIDGVDESEVDNSEDSLIRIAQSIVENTEKYLGRRLPKDEIHHLYSYLSASRMQFYDGEDVHFSDRVIAITKRYLDLMQEELTFEKGEQSIFVDLANHIQPMLKRLEQGIRVKNGLLSQIQMTYPHIYQSVCSSSILISKEYRLAEISDDENGFLTLYFAKLLEVNPKKIRTVIVCTTGIGTSELLRAKVEKKFSELEIVDVLATRDLNAFDLKKREIRLIISTVNLPVKLGVDSILVSGILTADDQVRLQEKIEALDGK